MKKVKIFTCLSLLLMLGCKSRDDEKAEKIQNERNNILNVKDEIIDIKSDILFGNSMLYIVDDILIVEEIKPSGNKGIHLFNKNTFEYITSTGIMGHGPGEIIRYGRIGVDNKNRVLWVPDHGKKVMLKFPLDSVLSDEMYKPTKALALKDNIFIERFGLLNDSIALGKAVQVLSSNSYSMTMAKFNFNTNTTEKYGYEHPEATDKNSNSQFKLSVENNFYVNCYASFDLMTICDLDGNLKYNIYGPDGLENKDNKRTYFTGVDALNKNIIASYVGDVRLITNEFQRLQGNLPSKFLIFDDEGNYKKTIETGHKFSFFCVDERNKRVIAYFSDRDNPLGFFNLNLD